MEAASMVATFVGKFIYVVWDQSMGFFLFVVLLRLVSGSWWLLIRIKLHVLTFDPLTPTVLNPAGTARKQIEEKERKGFISMLSQYSCSLKCIQLQVANNESGTHNNDESGTHKNESMTTSNKDCLYTEHQYTSFKKSNATWFWSIIFLAQSSLLSWIFIH